MADVHEIRTRVSSSRDHALELLQAHRRYMQREQNVRAYLIGLARQRGLSHDEIAEALGLATIGPDDDT